MHVHRSWGPVTTKEGIEKNGSGLPRQAAAALSVLGLVTLASSCAPSLDSLEQRLRSPTPCDSEEDCRALKERAGAFVQECNKNITWYRQQSHDTDCSREARVHQQAQAAYNRVARTPASATQPRPEPITAAPQTTGFFSWCVVDCRSRCQSFAGPPLQECLEECHGHQAACGRPQQAGEQDFGGQARVSGAEDPNNCNNYQSLSLSLSLGRSVQCPDCPADGADWDAEFTEHVIRECSQDYTTDDFVLTHRAFLPSSVVAHPNSGCVQPYLNAFRSNCASLMQTAKRATARFDAERRKQQALQAQREAERQRWLQTPEGRKGNCILGCAQNCAGECDRAIDQATCMQVCRNTVQQCINACPR
jgi:hypothetical protein